MIGEDKKCAFHRFLEFLPLLRFCSDTSFFFESLFICLLILLEVSSAYASYHPLKNKSFESNPDQKLQDETTQVER